MAQIVQQKGCQICKKPRAKYSCPKCGIPYCSLGCYRDKKHEGCTESFYQDQVEEEMRARKADEETKKEMYMLIKRFQEQGVDEDVEHEGDEAVDIADRMGGLDLDNATTDDVWDRLTEAEREEFLKLLDGHELGKILEPWEPWWSAKSRPKVVEVGGSTDAERAGGAKESNQVPQISNINVPVQKLTDKVHPSVLNQLAQVSLAYVYMMRHLNGDPREGSLGAAFDDLTMVSPLLSSKVADIYTSAQESLIVGLFNIDEGMACEAKCALLDDVSQIYVTPGYAPAMISDMHGILKDLLAAGCSGKGQPKKAHVQRAERRVYFLLCMVLQMSRAKDTWEFMATDIAILRRRYESEGKDVANGEVHVPVGVLSGASDAAERSKSSKPHISII
ncbi:hypothetical protein GQ54DRAFT_292037 [Martensiomyces pterosporus]|nr:hypothetical protein GQ54DRAFT_292037 [Martensiomyces pterosporus]